MAPRAYWKGYLKLSLVSCPIALYPASSSSERVSFNRINKKTGNRLKQQNVDAETGDPGRQGGHRPRLRDRQGPVPPGRGRRAGKDPDREHAYHRNRQLRAARRDRRSLPRQPLLHRADRPGRAGGLRGHPRRHPRQEDGRARPRRHDPPRARHDAGSVRQGPAGDDVALCLRGPRPGRLFRRHSRPQAAGRDDPARRPHHRHQGRPFRSQEVRGSLRERARRAAAQEAGRPRGRAGEG